MITRTEHQRGVQTNCQTASSPGASDGAHKHQTSGDEGRPPAQVVADVVPPTEPGTDVQKAYESDALQGAHEHEHHGDSCCVFANRDVSVTLSDASSIPPQSLSTHVPDTAVTHHIFLFYNPISGGNTASVLAAPDLRRADLFYGIEHVRLRLWDIRDGPKHNKPGFKRLKALSDALAALPRSQPNNNVIRVIVAGGDGTVMWCISELRDHQIELTRVVIGVIPFGTGNDFARVLWWKMPFAPPSLCPKKVLRRLVYEWLGADIIVHDLWDVEVEVHPSGVFKRVDSLTRAKQVITKLDEHNHPVPVKKASFKMCNYFSIGVESRIGVGFERYRTSSPFWNKLRYAAEGLKKSVFKHTLKVNEIVSKMTTIDPITGGTHAIFRCRTPYFLTDETSSDETYAMASPLYSFHSFESSTTEEAEDQDDTQPSRPNEGSDIDQEVTSLCHAPSHRPLDSSGSASYYAVSRDEQEASERLQDSCTSREKPFALLECSSTERALNSQDDGCGPKTSVTNTPPSEVPHCHGHTLSWPGSYQPGSGLDDNSVINSTYTAPCDAGETGQPSSTQSLLQPGGSKKCDSEARAKIKINGNRYLLQNFDSNGAPRHKDSVSQRPSFPSQVSTTRKQVISYRHGSETSETPLANGGGSDQLPWHETTCISEGEWSNNDRCRTRGESTVDSATFKLSTFSHARTVINNSVATRYLELVEEHVSDRPVPFSHSASACIPSMTTASLSTQAGFLQPSASGTPYLSPAASLIAINIPSFAAGLDIWKSSQRIGVSAMANGSGQPFPPSDWSKPQKLGDGLLEFVTFSSAASMGFERMTAFHGRGKKVCQGHGPFELGFHDLPRHYRVYFQVDGEFYVLNCPHRVTLKHDCQIRVLASPDSPYKSNYTTVFSSPRKASFTSHHSASPHSP